MLLCMGLLVPLVKTTTVLLVMSPKLIGLYSIETGNVTDRIFAGLYLYLLKNPKAHRSFGILGR